jgi:hypothetical protein
MCIREKRVCSICDFQGFSMYTIFFTQRLFKNISLNWGTYPASLMKAGCSTQILTCASGYKPFKKGGRSPSSLYSANLP